MKNRIEVNVGNTTIFDTKRKISTASFERKNMGIINQMQHNFDSMNTAKNNFQNSNMEQNVFNQSENVQTMNSSLLSILPLMTKLNNNKPDLTMLLEILTKSNLMQKTNLNELENIKTILPLLESLKINSKNKEQAKKIDTLVSADDVEI